MADTSFHTLPTPTLGDRKTSRALRELVRAHHSQAHLMPGLIVHAACEVALQYRPDDWVSGDYADAFPLSATQTFICVADVCGKGLSSAMIAAGVRAVVRTQG